MDMKRLLIVFFAVLATGCGGSDSNFTRNDQQQAKVKVFIDDGAIQCISPGVLPEVTAKRLTDNNIEVFSSACAYEKDIAIAALCGLGDTGINVHSIDENDLNAAMRLGFSPVTDLDFGYVLTDCE